MKILRHRIRASATLIAAMAALLPVLAGCLPGSSDAVAPPNVSAPSDEVFANLLREIEERRPDRFNAAVDVSSNPPRERFFEDLTAFLNIAENIEFVVTVESRQTDANGVHYVFTWRRKHQDKETGETRNAAGKTEWTLNRATGRFLLVQQSGTALF